MPSMMTSNVEKAEHAPVPLPASAWRVTGDLQTAIERCLTEAGHPILSCRFTDRDCRHWHLRLLYGQTVDVFGERPQSELVITGFGTDLDRLWQLMELFDAV